MVLIQKTPSELHRELVASGVFTRLTQKDIAKSIGVNQGTISRIANGDFKRVNKSVLAICKYAEISSVRAIGDTGLSSLFASLHTANDPEKRKLVDIIRLALDLLVKP